MYLKYDSIGSVKLETVIDNLPLVVLVLDTDRRIEMANKKAEEFTNICRKEMIGKRPGDAFSCEFANYNERGCGYAPECESCFGRNQIMETIEAKSDKLAGEGQLYTRKHGLLDLKMTSVFLSAMEMVLVTIENLTEHKALERDRIEKDKLRAAVETAGAICHEMNQPLQVISGYIDLILASKDQDINKGEYLDITRKQLDRLVEIVGKLRNLKRYRTNEYLNGDEILDIAGSSTN